MRCAVLRRKVSANSSSKSILRRKPIEGQAQRTIALQPLPMMVLRMQLPKLLNLSLSRLPLSRKELTLGLIEEVLSPSQALLPCNPVLDNTGLDTDPVPDTESKKPRIPQLMSPSDIDRPLVTQEKQGGGHLAMQEVEALQIPIHTSMSAEKEKEEKEEEKEKGGKEEKEGILVQFSHTARCTY